jgi:hypothetical protein
MERPDPAPACVVRQVTGRAQGTATQEAMMMRDIDQLIRLSDLTSGDELAPGEQRHFTIGRDQDGQLYVLRSIALVENAQPMSVTITSSDGQIVCQNDGEGGDP